MSTHHSQKHSWKVLAVAALSLLNPLTFLGAQAKPSVSTGSMPLDGNIDTIIESRDPLLALPTVSYNVVVRVDPTKSDGTPWDVGLGQFTKPDPQIIVDGSPIGGCKDTHSCTLNFSSKDNSWDIEVYDKDVANDDFIGSGKCSVGKTCRIGNATITIGWRVQP